MKPILEQAVEIKIKTSDSFLIIKESLTRMGVGSFEKKELYQSCHIINKKGKYYISHFKLLYALENGNIVKLDETDWKRQNRIANSIEKWGLCTVVNPIKEEDMLPLSSVRMLKHSDKKVWKIIQKISL